MPDYFENKEVLFVGYSSRNKSFSNLIYKTLTKNGLEVYPVNVRKDCTFDINVYNYENLPKIPRSAYVLLKKENTKIAVAELIQKGVKKFLFQNKASVDNETLRLCKEKGIETAIACPMMLYGSGFHKIHRFFAGV